MRYLIHVICLLMISVAAAVAEPSSQDTAFGQEIMECVGGKVQLRAQIAELQAKLKALETKAAEPTKPADAK